MLLKKNNQDAGGRDWKCNSENRQKNKKNETFTVQEDVSRIAYNDS